MASFMSSSLKTGKVVFIWPPDSLWHQPWYKYLEPPDLLECDDTDEKVDTELLLFSNPWSDEGEGVRVGATHGSHCLWPWSWLCCDLQSQSCCNAQSWCNTQQVCLGSSIHTYQCSRASPPVGAHHNCKTYMAVMQTDMNGSPSFSASFSDGLDNPSPAFSQV